MIRGIFLPLSFILFFSTVVFGQNTLDISGEWQVKLDATNGNAPDGLTLSALQGVVKLPGSLAENGFGYKTVESDFGVLTPTYKYIGKAWYTREIQIPAKWKNKNLELFLERVLWESRVSIDGVELNRADALGSPHVHSLGKLTPGKHQLTILVDNDMIHNIGDKGHAYGDYTQTIWNGIVGKMELRVYDATTLVSTQVYPKIHEEYLTIQSKISSEKAENAAISYEIYSINSPEKVLSGKFRMPLNAGESVIEKTIETHGKLKRWSEFTPEVYVLKLYVKAGKNDATQEIEFGFSEFTHKDNKLYINDIPVYLRGNLDCVHFPLTGYPSCKVEDWERIFKIYKSYGLNHARFHSWCPPEAAFKAANRVGIYLQAEASIWIDWWMSTDMIARGRPEMDTKGHPKGLGLDPERDKFVIAEMNRVVDTYGNHPSFTLFCIGNELGNSDFNVMKNWVADLKKRDPRRLYSVSTARTITEVDDFNATHYIKDVGRTRGLNGPGTNWDFEGTYAKMHIPIIAHEIGQWPVYPRWSEIDKYSGVLKARNFEEFKQKAEQNGIASQADAFADASGALNQIMYKYEIESFLRTPSCAGFQLLSLQDYPGQGEALIGWLDTFWDSKRITTPERFKEHCTTSVPLLRLDKHVWQNDEVLNATIQLYHYAENDLNAALIWQIADASGKVYAEGNQENRGYKNGEVSDAGSLSYDLSAIDKATKLHIYLKMNGTIFQNEYPIWVYPKDVPATTSNDIIVTNQLTNEIQRQLKAGAKVLLQANQLGTESSSVKALFYPLYWSYTFFPGQGKTNIGLLLQDTHPAFADFPTDFHSHWQWESISADAKGFIINELPKDYFPIAQPIDDFHRNNKVASIFEVKVGEGKLLVCGYNLETDRPVARQLKYSLLNYMQSSNFNPTQTVSEAWLAETLKYIPEAEKAGVPKEFSNAILYVDAAANLKTEKLNAPWTKEADAVKISENTTYSVSSAEVLKAGENSSWIGSTMEIKINCPEGILGSLLVSFTDPDNNRPVGLINFEGRDQKIAISSRNDDTWVKLHVMREDSNDGKLILQIKTENGKKFRINHVVLLKE